MRILKSFYIRFKPRFKRTKIGTNSIRWYFQIIAIVTKGSHWVFYFFLNQTWNTSTIFRRHCTFFAVFDNRTKMCKYYYHRSHYAVFRKSISDAASCGERATYLSAHWPVMFVDYLISAKTPIFRNHFQLLLLHVVGSERGVIHQDVTKSDNKVKKSSTQLLTTNKAERTVETKLYSVFNKPNDRVVVARGDDYNALRRQCSETLWRYPMKTFRSRVDSVRQH